MKALERQSKFNEFQQLTQEGNLSSVLIARQLGITLNTVYNWRKKLRLEIQSVPPISPEMVKPAFSHVVVTPDPEQARRSCIEIIIGNNIVFRIPDQSPQETLQTILDSVANWKFKR